MNGSRRTIADSREAKINPRFTASFVNLSINIYLDLLQAIIPVMDFVVIGDFLKLLSIRIW